MRGRKGRERVQEGKGWRETGLAGPPVPGQHGRNQTVQVRGDRAQCAWDELLPSGGAAH